MVDGYHGGGWPEKWDGECCCNRVNVFVRITCIHIGAYMQF